MRSGVVTSLLVSLLTGVVADQRLPPSPCPRIFSYEGETVDWDRWYGEVSVETDVPLTGLRLDVWLSRPAVALRHNWDGNVTTLDNRRFTILDLYKRIEPGPPTSARIVVKFDENKEVPLLRAIEFNGRRICGDEVDTFDIAAVRPLTVRPLPPAYYEDTAVGGGTQRGSVAAGPDYYPEIITSSNSKYDFDRTTRRPYEAPVTQRVSGGNRRPTPVLDTYDTRRRPAARPQEETLTTYDRTRDRPQHEIEPVVRTPVSSSREPSGSLGASGAARRPVGLRPHVHSPSEISPAEETLSYDVTEVRSPPRKQESGGTRTSARDPAIDVRFDAEVQPLSGHSAHAPPSIVTSSNAARPPIRQDDTSTPGQRESGTRVPATRDPGNSGNAPGHSVNLRPGDSGQTPGRTGQNPGHSGQVPGHSKEKVNVGYSSNKFDSYNGERNRPVESARPSSTHRPQSNSWKHGDTEDGHECGRTLAVAPLVTHGQGTARGQWPWHAALYQNKGADLKYICGGTLISPKFVITAAHCVTRATTGRAVDPDSILAYLGKYHLHRWTNEEGVQQGKVVAIHVHPDFNTSDFRGDVALLEFSSPLSYSQFVRPICLWDSKGGSDLRYVIGEEGYVVGWGYNEHNELTEQLRLATMPIVEQRICLRSYPEFFSRFTNDKTFCAGFKNGTSACNGDSGGGLVLPRERGSSKTWYLRGLVSNSVAQESQRVCNTDHYVVFTDLAKYGAWIDSYVQ